VTERQWLLLPPLPVRPEPETTWEYGECEAIDGCAVDAARGALRVLRGALRGGRCACCEGRCACCEGRCAGGAARAARGAARGALRAYDNLVSVDV